MFKGVKQKIKELEIKKRLNEKKNLTKEELEKTVLTDDKTLNIKEICYMFQEYCLI